MSTNYKSSSRNTANAALGICSIFFIAYAFSCDKLLNHNPQPEYTKSSYYNELSNNSSNINISGQCVHKPKKIKSIKVIPTTETYEVSQWVTSGDWSHDYDNLTVTIPSQRVIMDLDYVEDNWDNYQDDPEDEIQYPPDLFQ